MNRHHKQTIKRMKNYVLRLQSECSEVGDAVDLDMDLESLSDIERILSAQEGGETVAKRKKPLAVRRSKISAGNYRVTRQDGEIFIIQKGVVAKGWTIENQRTFAIDSAVDLGQANYMITNCIGKVCAEVFHK